MRAFHLACLVAAATLSQLSCLSVVQAQNKVANDYLVTNLPDLAQEDAAQLKQFAGHIALDEAAESNLFFWLVTNKRTQKTPKLIIWLNGGPGCSSADGYFLESGPLRFVNKKLTVNKGGWHEFANVVFLDQPVGTGLSYTSNQLLGNLDDITTHFLAFLKNFFAVFPEYAHDELYLAGESYAGTYIPYFAKGILDHNDDLPIGHTAYNLQGLAIGNGWIDPLHQYTSFIPYVEHHGLSTPDLMTEMVAQQEMCLDAIRMQDLITQESCESLVRVILKHSYQSNAMGQCTNQYDIRLTDSYPACGQLWPYELPEMEAYLTRPDVISALHASGADLPWSECSRRVNSALRFDNSVPAVTFLPDILTRTKVLLFSGDKDLICNHIGTEYLISNMTWQGATGFEDTPKIGWTVENQPAGVWRQARNLTYVLLYNASHMVPYDTPLAALDMMNRFMGLDPTLQYFASKLDTDVSNGQIPPGGEKVDIDQPNGSLFINGSAALLFVLMAVGVGIFIMTRNRRGQAKMDDSHEGIQWLPLSNSRSGGHERVPMYTDELDELVVEANIQDSDDDDDDDEDYNGSDGRNRYRGQSPQPIRS